MARRVALAADRLYSGHISVSYGQETPQAVYAARLVASIDSSALVVTLTRSSDERQTEPYTFFGPLSAVSEQHLASAIFAQWSSFHDFLSAAMEEPPVYVDELPLEPLSRTTLGMPGMLVPMSPATRADGTLLIRSGDCDDSSALLGSLLESVGVRTAIMTSPGHVFLAFDTGEPKENLWLFSHGGLQAISHQGSVWLPVETTILKEGFLATWKNASELVRRQQGRIGCARNSPLPGPAREKARPST